MEVAKVAPMEMYLAARKERAGHAKRCLFGTPSASDRSRTQKMLSEQNLMFQRDFVKTWNFDCKNDLPLEGGRFEWKMIEETASVPLPYHNMGHVTCYPQKDTPSLPAKDQVHPENRRDSGIFSSGDEQSFVSSGEEEEENTSSTSCQSSSPLCSKRKRKITDYYKCVKKRRVVGASSKSVKRLH